MNLFYIFLFTFFLYISTSNSEDPSYYICNQDSKTTYNSRISKNINILLSELAPGTLLDYFITTSYGVGPNQVFGLAQCRGDVPKKECSICIKNAVIDILNICPNIVNARIWYDFCLLRYDKVNFFNQVDTSGAYLINVRDVTGVDKFSEMVGALMSQLSTAAIMPPNNGFARAWGNISSSVVLYGLVQCTRDLSEVNCGRCLAIASGNLPNVCGNRRGCRAIYSSCYVRYELYPFFYARGSRKSLVHRSVDKKSVMVLKP